ncbi:hypothetical protein ACPOL_4402 [Acidisarcina polymorpha]|uniref:Uncharacterized protein n=1 Tax=Acidisarcina polymorpha TaxID=2211140 RepID=A0A2Z5G4S9_9BACT|nr:hypothetical protein [Acidisarcina polymorpha]AXC13675.1 hypothetical protein ACPOL_4402 [Acidisarcina polymorpha]
MALRGVLTLAFGAPKYIEMAKALGRSLMLHAPETPRAVVTDSRDPELRKLYTATIEYRPSFGSNVRQKMYLDRYSPFDETLFIDSDCLVVGKLDVFWEAFRGLNFAVQGVQTLRTGDVDTFLDVDFVLQRFSLSGIPKFNGGIYFFNKSPEAVRLFETARSLLKNARDLRFSDFRRDGPADEALYGVAMAIEGLSVTDLGRRGMWSPGELQGKIKIDVAKGICSFVKRVGEAKVPRLVEPDIMHFFGRFTESLTYRRECVRLKKLLEGEIQKAGAITLSDELKLRAMTIPLGYHRLRGYFRRATKAPVSARLSQPPRPVSSSGVLRKARKLSSPAAKVE